MVRLIYCIRDRIVGALNCKVGKSLGLVSVSTSKTSQNTSDKNIPSFLSRFGTFTWVVWPRINLMKLIVYVKMDWNHSINTDQQKIYNFLFHKYLHIFSSHEYHYFTIIQIEIKIVYALFERPCNGKFPNSSMSHYAKLLLKLYFDL